MSWTGLKKKLTSPIELKRQWIEPKYEAISIRRQCELLGLNRSTLYYQPIPVSDEELQVMRLIDEVYTRCPFYGSRRIAAQLTRERGDPWNRKRIQRLMRIMGIRGVAPGPDTSKPHPENKIYPYLLRGLLIDKVNQVWSTDITYIPMTKGFMYLVAVIDWHSRYVLSWELSNTMETTLLPVLSRRALKVTIFMKIME